MYRTVDLFSASFYVRTALVLDNMRHPMPLCGVEHRLIYCLNGETTVQVAGDKLILNPRDVLIISAGVPYKIISSTGRIFFYYFDLSLDNAHIKQRIFPISAKKFTNDKIICKCRLLVNNKTFDYLHIKTVYGISEILLDICKYNIRQDEFSSKYKSSLLMAAVSKAFLKLENNETSKLGELIKAFVNANYYKDISVDDAAKALSYHQSYINRIIKKETGMPFHKYLVITRLNKAMDLLSSGADLAVEEVALRVGFKDPKYFATSFKKHFGISPSKAKNI